MRYATRIIYMTALLLCITTRATLARVAGSIQVTSDEDVGEAIFNQGQPCQGEVGDILKKIRALMTDTNTLAHNPIHAYIVPMTDAHQSEYVADHDKRLQYISKFTGSAGDAVVTAEHAVLWTDSRYHLQAEKQLDASCWTLIKKGLPNEPSMTKWLLDNLPSNSSIGVDPMLMTNTLFTQIADELKKNDSNLLSIGNNLVDIVWNNQPARESNEIVALPIKYTGKEAGLKITEVLNKIKDDAIAETVVITTLDDIAWLLNLRGSDIAYNPVFFSYVILTSGNISSFASSSSSSSLPTAHCFVDKNRLTNEALLQLDAEQVQLIVRDYSEILDGVREILNTTVGKILTSSDVSRAIAELIPAERRVEKNLLATMKSVKNPTEAKNLDNAHIRDGLALVQYLHWLNSTIDSRNVTELSGSDKLAWFRSQQDNFRGLSFEAISAVGDHASIIHYSPTEETDKRITRDEVYLIDSGGQYWDGTTDVTRTVHFGTPTTEEKMCYTRVLKGFIALATSVVPKGTALMYFDYMARRALWQAGLNYGHGTGHGVGMYLLVHEYPPLITRTATKEILENIFTTNEPGYYKDDEFGIRIEDVIQVIKSDIEHAFDGHGGLTFKSITYAPLATNLIVNDMLTKEEANYVNTYNKRVLDTIGPLLLKRRLMDAHKWLLHETRQICSWSK